MKKKLFWIVYLALVIVLIGASIGALQYVKGVLKEYEALQPENIIEERVSSIQIAAQAGFLDKIIEFPKLEQSEYDIDIKAFDEYKAMVKAAGKFTYRIKTGGYSESGQSYEVMADDKAVAVITLKCIGEKQRLAILTMSEWEVESIKPVLTLLNYSYTFEVPKDLIVKINDKVLTGGSTENGITKYSLSGLYSEPTIEITDKNGYKAAYDIIDNNVKPVVYSYKLTLPKEYGVYGNGKRFAGKLSNDMIEYDITTIYDTIDIADAYGNSIEYRNGSSIVAYDYKVSIPSNFSISIKNVDMSKYKTGVEQISSYKYCEEYVELPKLVSYEFKRALAEPDIIITDNLGKQIDYRFIDYAIRITGQSTQKQLPAELLERIDVLSIAQMWSKLMSRDLSGTERGFETIKNYLIKDSYLYNVAYKWVNSLDITFISSHTLSNPPFTEEDVTNFVSYGDNCFSCDISFLKQMDLISRKQHITDKMNSTFYFLYCDDTDDGSDNAHWVILDIQEIVE